MNPKFVSRQKKYGTHKLVVKYGNTPQEYEPDEDFAIQMHVDIL